jgi:hypothetical protein
LIIPKQKKEIPPPKIPEDSSSTFSPKSNMGGAHQPLSPSKTNEERVARIIKDLNW